jgi:YfiH family protein
LIAHPTLEGVRHGFFTRHGGVGEGLYASLNCGFGAADAPAVVEANRACAMTSLGLPATALVTVHQIHSADVVTVETPWPRERNPKADALVTRQAGVCLGVLTADCVPVLFADPAAGVIGAAHAGWKGALGGVLAATVEAMCRLGAEVGRVRAAIGPAIQQASYEVGPEFPGRFAERDAANLRFFQRSARAGHFMFDLPGFVEHSLTVLGLETVGNVRLDTCADEQRFFSYRRATLRSEPDYGRMLSAIALTE